MANKFSYNGENTTVKWDWLTSDDNPYWEHTVDTNVDEFLTEYVYAFTNECGLYRIYIEAIRKETRQWVEYYDDFDEREKGYYSDPDETFQVYASVSGASTGKLVQKVLIDVGSFDEVIHTVETLAHKAVKWCLHH